MAAIQDGPERKAAVKRPKPPANNSRAIILRTAAKLFAKKTYDEVTIRDIAALAKVQSPTIYHFFKSKAGLYREALLDYYEKFAPRSALLPASTPPRERLYTLIHLHLQALGNDETVFQLLHRELLSRDYRFKKTLAERLLRDIYAHIDDILSTTRHGAGNRVIPGMIMSMILGYFQVARFEKYLPGFVPRGHGPRALAALATEITELILPQAQTP